MRIPKMTRSSVHRRSQDFVWGCTFSCPKSWRPFFSRHSSPSIPSRNIPPNPAKTILKIDSCSRWGCTSCPRGCTYTFSL